MKNFKWLSLVLVVAVSAACDPYDDVPGGNAQTVRVLATSGLDATIGTAAGTDWTLTDVTSACDPQLRRSGDPAGGNPRVAQNSVFVTLNKQIDGGTVQTSVDNCTPVGGWVTGSDLSGLGLSWYSCYSPASPSPQEGGSVVLFLAPEESDGGTPADPTDDTPAASGWAEGYDDNGYSFVPADGDAVTTYTVSGSRLTDLGVGTITINVAPNPGDAYRFDDDDATYLDITGITQTGLTIAIDSACSTAATRYTVERAPNIVGTNGAADRAGTYAEVGTGLTGPTFTDSGLTAGTKYWYRVTATTSTGVDGDPAVDSVTTLP